MKFVIGLDFSTNDATAIVVNAESGEIIATSVMKLPRWQKRKYCNPKSNQWRQHPLDYLETMESTIKDALTQCTQDIIDNIVGIAIDTTGSTPAIIDEQGQPLALHPEFANNPNAMFILWKDHTAVSEAEEINNLCKKWHTDYSKYEGGVYSAEWFWAKAIHVMREDDAVASRAYSIVELCEWLPAILTGVNKAENIIRSRCVYGHKAMWSEEWGGLPSEEFLVSLEPKLSDFRSRMSQQSFTADMPVGHLCKEWSKRLGLSENIIIAGGAYDCHMGAVGAGVKEKTLIRVVGQSTCDVMVASKESIANKFIKGICGQVDGSVIPGMIGLEAGQSCFADIFDTFYNLLSYPIQKTLPNVLKDKLSNEEIENIVRDTTNKMIDDLLNDCTQQPFNDASMIATDWINGRRSPDANQKLKGTIAGLSLGVNSPQLLRTLIESASYGARSIIERFESEGIEIREVIGIGEITLRTPLIMQIMSDIINKPIKICNTNHVCALGAAMFAATAAGIYPKVENAIFNMNSGFAKEYHPIKTNTELYNRLYKKYLDLGSFTEHSNLFTEGMK